MYDFNTFVYRYFNRYLINYINLFIHLLWGYWFSMYWIVFITTRPTSATMPTIMSSRMFQWMCSTTSTAASWSDQRTTSAIKATAIRTSSVHLHLSITIHLYTSAATTLFATLPTWLMLRLYSLEIISIPLDIGLVSETLR